MLEGHEDVIQCVQRRALALQMNRQPEIEASAGLVVNGSNRLKPRIQNSRDDLQYDKGKHVMKPRTLSGLALAGSATALLALYANRYERQRAVLTRYVVPLNRPGLPADGLVLLHLSDFHFRAGGAIQARKIAGLRELLAGEAYDVLALTGDLIHDRAGFDVVLRLVEDLHPRLAAFYVPGNHDYAEYSVWGVFGHTWRESGAAGRRGLAEVVRAGGQVASFVRKVATNQLVRLPVGFNDVPAMMAELASRGVEPLVNRAVRVQGRGADLWFAGVDDLVEGRLDLAAALAEVPDTAALVLLSHNPDVWLDSRVDRADLVLSGHTHGGQVRLPWLGAAHTQGTHLSRRQAAGWFQRGPARMFVSRGLGESIPLRLGVPPQAALIRLIPAIV